MQKKRTKNNDQILNAIETLGTPLLLWKWNESSVAFTFNYVNEWMNEWMKAYILILYIIFTMTVSLKIVIIIINK